MFDLHFSAPYLAAYLVFGVIGMSAFNYGRKLQLWQPICLGLLLMLYPVFVSNLWLTWGIGVGFCVLLWFYHDE